MDGANTKQDIIAQVAELRREVLIARQERNAMRAELKALKRYVSILVQADLEREMSDLNVLVLQNPINRDALIPQEGAKGGDENIFQDELTEQ